jgi:type IV pilus assembly protein PilO
MNIDLKQAFSNLGAQFQDLQGRHPGQWPLAPRLLCAAGAMVAVIAAGYFFYWQGQFEEQDRLAAEEITLRDDYRSKMAQAINLEALQEQKAQVDQYVERLQKQLPSKAEMAALLSDINQIVVRDYYAELPIDIKVTGKYHDIGSFSADIANLPRIVTLNNLNLSTGKDGMLTLDAVAKTFRYLDQDEAASQRKIRDSKKKGAKPGATP